MLIKKILALPAFLLLSACGGSGNDNTAIDNDKANSAPVMAGILSISVKPQQKMIMNYALNDAENDRITVTYNNMPQWITPQLNNKELRLEVSPSFFDIAESNFDIILSDGKAQNSYTITITVQDDPSLWQLISNPIDSFIGQWRLDDIADLHLYEDFTGFYTDIDNSSYRVEWSYNNNGYIELRTVELNCTTYDCEDIIELYTIAESTGKKRWVLESDEQVLSITATKQQQHTSYVGYYTSPSESVNYVNNMTSVQSEYILTLPMTLENEYSTFNWIAQLNATLDTGNRFNTTTEYSDYGYLRFSRSDVFNQQEQLQINVKVDDIHILPSSEKTLAIQYKIKPSLADNSINIQNYSGLADFLSKDIVKTLVQISTEQIDAPQIELNTRYFSGFRFKHQGFAFGGNEVEFLTSQTGRAFFKIAGTDTNLEVPFSWLIENRELVITMQEETYRYPFIKTPRNEINIISSNNATYPFVQLADDVSQNDLIHTFRDESSASGLIDMYYSFYSNNSASLFSTYEGGTSGYLWRSESDGSITVLESHQCNYWYDFNRCETQLKEKWENQEISWIRYRNYKVITKTADGIIVQMSYNLQQANQSTVYQTLYRWLNVSNQ